MGSRANVYLSASTQEIYTVMLEIRTSTRGIDTRFTFFQDPVRVRDALGRVFAFPSELSIEALNAEVKARFKQRAQYSAPNFRTISRTSPRLVRP